MVKRKIGETAEHRIYVQPDKEIMFVEFKSDGNVITLPIHHSVCLIWGIPHELLAAAHEAVIGFGGRLDPLKTVVA